MHSTQPQVTEDGLSRQLAEERLDQMTYTDFCNPSKTHTHAGMHRSMHTLRELSQALQPPTWPLYFTLYNLKETFQEKPGRYQGIHQFPIHIVTLE